MNVQETADNRFDVYFARDLAEFLTDLAAQMTAAGVDAERVKTVLTWAADRFHLQIGG